MNPKIIKLKAERAKNDEKIAALRSRNRELDESIVELENTDIIGLARATGMSMEEHTEHYISLGMTKKDAIKAVASDRGLAKSEVYAEVMKK